MTEYRGYTISFDCEYPPVEVRSPSGERLGRFHTEKDAYIFIKDHIYYGGADAQ